ASAITALETILAATPTGTQEPAATLTAIPTPIPKPTEDPYRFDIEKFHSFPQSYEYLLAHPDEFVQATDPLTDRAAFDKWWNEAFIPALGPVSERPLTVNTLNCGDSRLSHMCNADLGRMPVLEQPTFFGL
ncbi:MAG: hypothetical protein ABFD50_03370, partial [Smithella sp.]